MTARPDLLPSRVVLRRAVFVLVLSGLSAATVLGTAWREHLYAGASGDWLTRALFESGLAALVVAGSGALMGRYFFLLPLVDARRNDLSARRREADDLQQATHAARRAQAEADRANAAKTDFLACMSHEIRTPLNAVIGFASLLLADGDDPAKVRLYAERIHGSGKALLRIVDDILDFSQVEAGALDLELAPFSLPALVDECVSIVQPAALAKHLSLQVSLQNRLPRGVLGDAARLRQILLNLLNNAIKFTEEGSVLLDIRQDRTDSDTERLQFSVVDTGIGISRDDLPRLFRRFEQVDGSIRRIYGGTGLGLAISKRLAKLMGGEITVESERRVGSTFRVTIPLPSTELVAGTDHSPAATSAPCRVLLVEDVPINQELARRILEASGHSVDVVCNGAEAIMAVQDADYDAVLMDLQMPYLDGLAATRRIRALAHRCRDVPIVAMTANVLPGQVEAARAAGMAEIVRKPVSAGELHAALARIADGRGQMIETETSTGDRLGKLVAIIGEPRVRELLVGLARSLVGRFEADETTPEGRAQLRRQAHASIAGSGMLGFSGFAESCRALEVAPEDEAFRVLAVALRAEAQAVAAKAEAMAAGAVPLTSRLAA